MCTSWHTRLEVDQARYFQPRDEQYFNESTMYHTIYYIGVGVTSRLQQLAKRQDSKVDCMVHRGMSYVVHHFLRHDHYK